MNKLFVGNIPLLKDCVNSDTFLYILRKKTNITDDCKIKILVFNLIEGYCIIELEDLNIYQKLLESHGLKVVDYKLSIIKLDEIVCEVNEVDDIEIFADYLRGKYFYILKNSESLKFYNFLSETIAFPSVDQLDSVTLSLESSKTSEPMSLISKSHLNVEYITENSLNKFDALFSSLTTNFKYKLTENYIVIYKLVPHTNFANLRTILDHLKIDLYAELLESEYKKNLVHSLNVIGNNQRMRTVLEQIKSDPLNNFLFQMSIGLAKKKSKVILLHNFITIEDILCEELKSEIIAFFKKKAVYYGTIKELHLHHCDNNKINQDFNCGKLFIEFDDQLAARVAQHDLNGLIYEKKLVNCAFYPFELYKMKIFNLFPF